MFGSKTGKQESKLSRSTLTLSRVQEAVQLNTNAQISGASQSSSFARRCPLGERQYIMMPAGQTPHTQLNVSEDDSVELQVVPTSEATAGF